MSSSDSDSSSDGFTKAPIDLDELEDLKSNSFKTASTKKRIIETSESDDDAPVTSEYFDFTNIISAQNTLDSLKTKHVNDSQGTAKEIKENDKKPKASKKKTLRKAPKNVVKEEESNLDISDLLAIGEGTVVSKNTKREVESDDSDVSDVDGGDIAADKDEIPTEGVQVTIELPDFIERKKKKKFDIEAALKRRLYAIKKENQVFIHKVHLLCLIAHGKVLNTIINSQELLGTAMSIIPNERRYYPPKHADMMYLEQLVVWFSKKIKVLDEKPPKRSFEERLCMQFDSKQAFTTKDMVLMFVCLARVLGLKCRLMINLQPEPLKPKLDTGLSVKKTSENKPGTSSSQKVDSSDEPCSPIKKIKNSSNTKAQPKFSSGKSTDSSEQSSPRKPRVASNNARKKASTHDSSSDDEVFSKSSKSVTPIKSKQSARMKTSKGSSTNPKKGRQPTNSKSSSKSSNKSPTKSTSLDRRVLSSDSENEVFDKSKKKKLGNDYWAEVFVEAEEKWISADVRKGKIHCVDQIYSRCTHPVSYVLAFNAEGTIKDLTQRYAPQYATVTRKQRVDEAWWEETLRPYKPKQTAREREEDHELKRILESKPLPSTISEYKSHPLYALRRHLLKFEAIYPPEPPPLGFVRGEPVYSRLCVSQLHTRETWMRKAKVVRLGEQPYKIVKARPKYDKMTGNIVKDLPLELFGYWQVENYIPPPAVDGKVPRNEYGNVELYQPSMLPGGTVHLQLPGLYRVARKLKIDCAPAVVGWEYSGGGSHPVLDGFIVCEEFKDQLLDAWNKDIDESAKREQDKREARIYGNWKRLIRGLLIRERLQKKYSFTSTSPTEEDTSSKNKRRPFKRKTK